MKRIPLSSLCLALCLFGSARHVNAHSVNNADVVEVGPYAVAHDSGGAHYHYLAAIADLASPSNGVTRSIGQDSPIATLSASRMVVHYSTSRSCTGDVYWYGYIPGDTSASSDSAGWYDPPLNASFVFNYPLGLSDTLDLTPYGAQSNFALVAGSYIADGIIGHDAPYVVPAGEVQHTHTITIVE